MRARCLTLAALLVGALALIAIQAPARGTRGPATTVRPEAGNTGAVPAAARPFISRTLGASDARFAIHRRAVGWLAANPAQRLAVHFSRGGATLSSQGLAWPLGLRALGRGLRATAVVSPSPSVAANTAQFRLSGLDEWYVNGPLGLEQGFTLWRRPSPAGGKPLTLALGMPRGVSSTVDADGRSLVLTARGGRGLLYSGLRAVDARGQSLRAWLQVLGPRLLLHVADRGAAYPLTVDPFVQSKLTYANGGANDILGDSLAVSGDGSTVVAGVPGAPGAGTGQGAVYVFSRGLGGWGNESAPAVLTASDGADYDHLGSSVAVSNDGSVIAAGAPYVSVGANSQLGAVYVFVRGSNGWQTGQQTGKLTASGGTQYDRLGSSVAISADGSLIASGAPNGAADSGNGEVLLFSKPSTGWADSGSPTYLTASDAASGDHLGASVAVSGDGMVVAGAPGAGSSQGAAYVFQYVCFFHPCAGWKQEGKLTNSGGSSGDLMGTSVATSGGIVVAGAPGVSSSRGAAYVFVKPSSTSGTWSNLTSPTATLTASSAAAGDNLGNSVAVSSDGSLVLAGAPTTSSAASASSGPGSAYLFKRPSAAWSDVHETAKLTASDGANGDAFGWGVAMSSDGATNVASAPEAKIGSNARQGAAYLFNSSTTTAVSCSPGGVVVGQSSTCTATVTDTGSGTATPAGTVSFGSDSSGSFGSGGSCTLAPGTTGVASCQIAYTPTAVGSGTHTITANYGGDSGHGSSGSSTQLGVALATTSTSVSCQPQSVAVGRSTACKGTVTDLESHGFTPTGRLRFTSDSHGSFSAGACTLAPTTKARTASCVVHYTPTAVGFGTHEITAHYAGDSRNAASLGTTQVAVELASTSTVVRCKSLSLRVGRSTVCVATVTDSASGRLTPTGKVTFTASGNGSFSHHGECLLKRVKRGTAACRLSYTAKAAGNHKLTGSYGGDANHFASHYSILIAAKK